MSDRDFVLIGEVATVHGLRGELSVQWHADSPSLLGRLPAVYLRRPGGGPQPSRHAVASWRMHHGRVLLRLADIPDRTAAEGLRGAELLARTADLPPPSDGEVFLHQLEGLDVFLPDGSRLGILAHFLLDPQELWVIHTPDGREVLFPPQPQFVPSIDLDNRRVVIDPPPGLLDLYVKG